MGPVLVGEVTHLVIWTVIVGSSVWADNCFKVGGKLCVIPVGQWFDFGIWQ